ncbi:MAG: DUF5677 domain-containing protein [Thermoanaerobaculia bacterium]
MNLAEKTLPRLRSVLDSIHVLVKGLHFDRRKRQHLLAGALLGRILEEAEGIYAMLERSDSTCGFILLRSLLEAYVDLLNIASDPAYAEFMLAAFFDQYQQLLEAVLEKGSKNPFLAGIVGISGSKAADELESVRSKIKELEGRQVKPLKVRQRFKRADQLRYYEGPYAHLCLQSHNNINVLVSRHLRFTDAGDAGVEIRGFDLIEDKDAQLISDTTAGISANCVVAVKELLDGKPVLGLDQLTEALGKLRELWPEEEVNSAQPEASTGQ